MNTDPLTPEEIDQVRAKLAVNHDLDSLRATAYQQCQKAVQETFEANNHLPRQQLFGILYDVCKNTNAIDIYYKIITLFSDQILNINQNDDVDFHILLETLRETERENEYLQGCNAELVTEQADYQQISRDLVLFADLIMRTTEQLQVAIYYLEKGNRNFEIITGFALINRLLDLTTNWRRRFQVGRGRRATSESRQIHSENEEMLHFRHHEIGFFTQPVVNAPLNAEINRNQHENTPYTLNELEDDVDMLDNKIAALDRMLIDMQKHI